MGNKNNWKKFQKKLPEWQESYMEKLNNEYIELLRSDGQASEKFWKLENRIKQDKQKPGVILKMRQNNMESVLRDLILDNVITIEDISDFSDETHVKVVNMLQLDLLDKKDKELTK